MSNNKEVFIKNFFDGSVARELTCVNEHTTRKEEPVKGLELRVDQENTLQEAIASYFQVTFLRTESLLFRTKQLKVMSVVVVNPT